MLERANNESLENSFDKPTGLPLKKYLLWFFGLYSLIVIAILAVTIVEVNLMNSVPRPSLDAINASMLVLGIVKMVFFDMPMFVLFIIEIIKSKKAMPK